MLYQLTVLRRFIVKPLRRDAGATAVEYAFVVMLIALVIIGAVTAVGVNLANVFTDAEAGLP